MSEQTQEQQAQQGPPQPRPEVVIGVLQNEIAHLQGRLTYQMAVAEEIRAEAIAEIAARDSQIKGLEAQLDRLVGESWREGETAPQE